MTPATDNPTLCRWCRRKLDTCQCHSYAWQHAAAACGGLTERECTILNAFCNLDTTTKVIARALVISPKTIEIQVANIKRKMKARTLITICLDWAAALKEGEKMAEQIRPISPQDIFQWPNGKWAFRSQLNAMPKPNEAICIPKDTVEWLNIMDEQEFDHGEDQ